MKSLRLELTRLPWVKAALQSRWPQFILQAIALAGFALALLTGALGTPVGNHNFSIVFVWIAWWALLLLIAVPFFGRAWCSICPIPLPGEWLQRGALLKPQGRGWGRNWRWPNRLRNIWLQNVAFVLVALFSAVTLTQPRITTLVLSALLFGALGLSLLFERRAFCRYVCPVGGFIGLYAQVAPVEVRVKDTAICAAHTEKTCYAGSAEGYGCPWQVFPGGLQKNTYCGMCMECLRTCPQDNILIQVRPFGADLAVAGGRKLDEAFKAFIMLGSAIAYSAVMLGPWGALKTAAYAVGTPQWLGYALGLLSLFFGVLPGVFWVMVRLGLAWERSHIAARKAFTTLAYALVPLGLMAWVAFSLAFVFASFSYVWPALSDPFGWGQNLLGTAGVPWRPYAMGVVPFLQTGALLGGLAWAGGVTRTLVAELKGGRRLATLVLAFCALITLVLLWLLIG